MKQFTVKGFGTYSAYEKIYFNVEAETAEEALQLVIDHPEKYQDEAKTLDLFDSEYVDQESWEVLND